MRLRTRVLSFVLAGSMMLSATPVSAFAGTPVLGEGAVSPTALSETNSTDGVYSSRVDGSHELPVLTVLTNCAAQAAFSPTPRILPIITLSMWSTRTPHPQQS